MKDKVRRTFLLSRGKGLKNKEIAEIEGVAESTIEARMSHALLIMRKMFKDYIKYK
jgi:Sigma-70, region 4.